MGYLDDVLSSIGEVYDGGKGFEAGNHTVEILLAEETEQLSKKINQDIDVIKVSVRDTQDEERIGEATLYFHTEGGAKMAVTKVSGLLVHNAPEEKKEQIKELCKKVFSEASEKRDLKLTRKICMKLLAEKLVGKEAYFWVEINGDYKTSKYGDIWHYPQKVKEETAEEIIASDEDVTDEVELPEEW